MMLNKWEFTRVVRLEGEMALKSCLTLTKGELIHSGTYKAISKAKQKTKRVHSFPRSAFYPPRHPRISKKLVKNIYSWLHLQILWFRRCQVESFQKKFSGGFMQVVYGPVLEKWKLRIGDGQFPFT